MNPSWTKWLWIGLSLLIFIPLLFWGIQGCKEKNTEKEAKEQKPKTDQSYSNGSSSSSLPRATFTTHVTPCEWTQDGEFYLESDDPIAQKFPGISNTIIYSGKGKSEVPYGRRKGPIKFWDPSDPKNGKKEFRIYPVN